MSRRAAAFGRRFGVDLGGGPWNETLDVLLGHRSVRRFADDPIDDATVRTVVAAASSAATSNNLQLWSVVAVTDRRRIDRLAELAGD